MDIRPIKTEIDYQAALEEIERLFDATPKDVLIQPYSLIKSAA